MLFVTTKVDCDMCVVGRGDGFVVQWGGVCCGGVCVGEGLRKLLDMVH